MQDITEHLKNLNEASVNNTILESFMDGIDALDLNESKTDTDTKMEELYKQEPIVIRKFYVGFMKDLLEKLGKKDDSSYEDLGLWSASVENLDWYVKAYFKGSSKAKAKLAPLYKALRGLNQGYNDMKIDTGNDLFNKVSPIVKGQVLDLIKDPVLKNVVRQHEDGFAHLFIQIWGEEVGAGYSPLKKDEAKKIEKAFNPIKKLYTDYKVINNGKRDLMFIQGGQAKLYQKEYKKALVALEAMITAKND